MTCIHTETTAVLAAFGEAPTDFDDHLAACSACHDVVQRHAHTLATIRPVTAPVRSEPRRWGATAIGFLAAAVILLAAQLDPQPFLPIGMDAHPAATAHQLDGEPFSDTLDNDLAMLEIEIALYTLEES